MKPLTKKIALVAGATRGAGRGIAIELGAAGATVICTGRSTRAQASDLNRPETIEETAEMVSSAGGIGIAIRCDHTQESEVQALFERVKLEHGRLDILVNDIWGGEKLIEWGKKFWELDLEKALKLIERSVFSHLITSRHAVPLMLETGNGLLLEITDGEHRFYRGNMIYDFIKNALMRGAKCRKSAANAALSWASRTAISRADQSTSSCTFTRNLPLACRASMFGPA